MNHAKDWSLWRWLLEKGNAQDAINDLLMKKGSIPFGSVATSDLFGRQFCLALYLQVHTLYGVRNHGELFAQEFGHVFVAGVHELRANPITYRSKSRLYGLSAVHHITGLRGHSDTIIGFA